MPPPILRNCALSLMMALGATAQHPGTTFGNPQLLDSLPSWPQVIATEDLDLDGLEDIIAGGQFGLNHYKNLGAGIFAPASAISYSATNFLVLADVTGDFILDIVAGSSSSSSLHIWTGTSTGTFPTTPITIFTTHDLQGITSGDVDGDGYRDIVVGTKNQCSLFVSQGAGSFSAEQTIFAAGSSIYNPTLADIDSDGDLDLLFHNTGPQNGELLCYENVFASNPNFTSVAWSIAGDYASRDITWMDWNADGNLDLVTSNLTGTVYTMLGSGSISQPGSPTSLFTAAGNLLAADFDLDGDQDFVIFGSWAETYPTGFALRPIATTQNFSTALGVGDLDGDGDKDVILGGVTMQGFVSKIEWTSNNTTDYSTAAYGNGCGNLAIHADISATVGRAMKATITGAATQLAVMAIGHAPNTLDLSAIGMAGCSSLTTAEIFGLETSLGPPPSSFAFQATLPNDPALYGNLIFSQAFCYAPGSNALGVTASHAIAWRIER